MAIVYNLGIVVSSVYLVDFVMWIAALSARNDTVRNVQFCHCEEAQVDAAIALCLGAVAILC